MAAFFRHGTWKLFATFFLHRFAFTTNHVPVLPFCLSPRPVIRSSRYLPARVVLADKRLKVQYPPFARPRRRHLIRSSCASSCARHPYGWKISGTHARTGE